jgi:ABC-2 type transport system permease protein|uniref:ABC transporter permease n=1 Tax=Desulfobacca acetoxidans TaxID=60893 RepID=A0A7V6DNS1_9BACT
MSGVSAVLRKELTTYFATPIFYVMGFFFLLVEGFLFFFIYFNYFRTASFQVAQNPQLAAMLDPFQVVFRSFFEDLGFILLLLTPILTMRLLAEEKRAGTAELLFTYPIPDWGVIMGKFLAAFAVFATFLVFTVAYPVMFAFLTRMDWGQVVSGYLGVLLLGAATLALGLFASSLTANQIIAAISAFALLLLFWLIGAPQEMGSAGSGILSALSLRDHLPNLAKGVIETKDLLYYLCFAFFFLFLTKRQLESRRWRA